MRKKVVMFLKRFDGAEDFINDRIEEICSHEKLSAEKVIYFLVSFFAVYVFSLVFLALK